MPNTSLTQSWTTNTHLKGCPRSNTLCSYTTRLHQAEWLWDTSQILQQALALFNVCIYNVHITHTYIYIYAPYYIDRSKNHPHNAAILNLPPFVDSWRSKFLVGFLGSPDHVFLGTVWWCWWWWWLILQRCEEITIIFRGMNPDSKWLELFQDKIGFLLNVLI